MEAERPELITAASVLSWGVGGFSLTSIVLLSPLVIFWPQVVPKVPGSPFVEPTFNLFLASEITCLICGVLYIVAGVSLWKCRKSGGIIGIVAGTLGIIGSFFPPSPFSFAAMLPSIAVIILIAVRWDKLTG